MSKWKFLDSDTLKMIAIATMFIDHIGAAILLPTRFMEINISGSWVDIYSLFRMIGRTAFPIFVFLLAEGFFHTRSRARYFGRLALFSLLSEIPFDLAFYGVSFYRDSQNVFLTLSIGFLVIWGIESVYEQCGIGRELPEKGGGKESNALWDGAGVRYYVRGVLWLACSVPLIFAGCLAAEFLCTDYGGYGVLLTVLFYFGKRFHMPRLVACVGGYLLFLWEPWCIGGFLLILFYNGARKKRGKGFQYFFYLFYPVHLLVFGLLRVAFLAN